MLQIRHLSCYTLWYTILEMSDIMLGKVLIVEDDESILMGLEFCLEQEGFLVDTVTLGNDALKKDISIYDIVLLDLNLPDMHGFELLKKLHDQVPIIVLTANDEEVSIVQGLDMGAYDYITKPFKTRELISRMKAVLRRKNSNVNFLIRIHNIVIDTNSAKVSKNGENLFLTAMEYKILLILATNPNVVFTREKILADIWDVNEDYVNDNTLTVYIKRLREKIEDDPNNPKIIETVRGIGYKIGVSS